MNDYEINILTKKLNYNRNVIRVDMKKGKLLYTDKSVGAKGNQHGIIVHKSLNNKKKWEPFYNEYPLINCVTLKFEHVFWRSK